MVGTNAQYVKETVLTDEGEFLTVIGGASSDTYECCGGWHNDGQVDHAIVDGSCYNGLRCGGAVHVAHLVSYASWDFSARPSSFPPTTAKPADIGL